MGRGGEDGSENEVTCTYSRRREKGRLIRKSFAIRKDEWVERDGKYHEVSCY